jgi:hypothetical protein
MRNPKKDDKEKKFKFAFLWKTINFYISIEK